MECHEKVTIFAYDISMAP